MLTLLALPAVSAQASDPRLAERIETIVTAQLADQRIPAMSVGVAEGADTILAKGFGFADLENRVPATADTVYRIGSITKQYTSSLVMKLIEEGRLSLDDELTQFLPDYPVRGNRVTVRHLLNHTSGIKSITSVGERFDSQTRQDVAPHESIGFFKNEPFEFAPGESYRYNNSGYVLLGAIIEKVTGESYHEALREMLLDPLRLTRTGSGDTSRLISNRARGYALTTEGIKNAEYISMTQPYAGGALVSTAVELIEWSRLFHGGSVVSQASLDQMLVPCKPRDGFLSGYGFGVQIGEMEGHVKYSHAGGINGFTAILAHYPEADLHIAVLANSENANTALIEQRIARVVLGLSADTVKDLPLDETAAQKYVGEYALGQLTVRVFLEGGKLMIQPTGQPAFRIRFQGDHRFIPTFSDDISVEFNMYGARASSVVLYQGGRPMTVKRVE
jgi:CubicO group peptidase (beta-lactamase class C family)